MEKRRKKRSFTHLDQAKRDRLEIMLKEGRKQKDIAEVLGVDPATISREKHRKRKRQRVYKASIAQQKANAKRASSKYCGMAVESDTLRKNHIIAELKAHRSPDEIAGRIAREKTFDPIGKDAIYGWLYSPRGSRYAHLLCTKRRKKKPQKRTSSSDMIPNRKPLCDRPKRGVHAEGDTFVSKKKDGTAGGAMVAIPESNLLLGTKLESLRPSLARKAFTALIQGIAISDLTFDNGIENKEHERLPVPAYFCDPHAPWQKPHVENGIGLARRWFIPKGTNLNEVSEEELQTCLHILNGKYRRSLGFQSAYERSLERGIITPAFVKKKRLVAEKFLSKEIALRGRI